MILTIKDAEVHFVGMQVNSAVIFVLLRIESHEKASFVWGLGSSTSIIAKMVRWKRGGLLYYQFTQANPRERAFFRD
jgi:hypothetical protein